LLLTKRKPLTFTELTKLVLTQIGNRRITRIFARPLKVLQEGVLTGINTHKKGIGNICQFMKKSLRTPGVKLAEIS
jgi:hypothetical protein